MAWGFFKRDDPRFSDPPSLCVASGDLRNLAYPPLLSPPPLLSSLATDAKERGKEKKSKKYEGTSFPTFGLETETPLSIQSGLRR